MAELISEGYKKLNAKLNEKYADKPKARLIELSRRITELATKYKASSVLDYGCCKSATLSKLLGPMVRNYDPSIPKFSKAPEPADIVVCSHVLEHVEPENLDAVLNHLEALTLKLVILIVPNYKARILLEDGTNPHKTAEDWPWWKPRIEQRFEKIRVERNPRSFTFIGKPIT